jgi:hypothetical protein
VCPSVCIHVCVYVVHFLSHLIGVISVSQDISLGTLYLSLAQRTDAQYSNSTQEQVAQPACSSIQLSPNGSVFQQTLLCGI